MLELSVFYHAILLRLFAEILWRPFFCPPLGHVLNTIIRAKAPTLNGCVGGSIVERGYVGGSITKRYSNLGCTYI